MTSDAEAALELFLHRRGMTTAELRTFRPLQSSTQDGRRVHSDPVADLVAQDVQNLMLYHMPSSLRSRFISAAIPSLDPGVRAITNGNAEAAAFYAQLGVPFLVALYGADRETPDARRLNARRASRRLGLDLERHPVFRQQQEQLYRYRLASRYPRLQLYIDSQKADSDAYAPYIDAISDAWCDDLAAQFDAAGSPAGDPDRKTALAHVRTAARKGRRGSFWAWALYRDLLRCIPLEFGPDALLRQTNPEDAALRIKQAVTLLDVLDPVRYFSRNYLDRLMPYILATHLTARVDAEANAENLIAYARAALEQFAASHRAADDPTLLAAAGIARRLVTADAEGNDPLGAVFRTALAAAGKLEGRDVARVMESIAAAMTGAKIEPWLVTGETKHIALTLLKGALGTSALGLVMSGGMPLDALPELRREKILIGIGASLSHSFALLVHRAAHTAGFFAQHAVSWSNLGHTWAQWKVFDPQTVYAGGFTGWILREKGGTLGAGAHWTEHVRAVTMPGARYDYGYDQVAISRLFGRNFDEFMAYRIGAILGIINLYLAVAALREASQPLAVAAAGVSLAGASFSLIGAAGGWVCSAFGRFALAGQLSSVMSTLAFAATIVVVAIVVLQVLREREEKPPELRRFAHKEAAEAGLDMPFGTAIEYIAPTGAGEGVALADGRGRFLHIAPDGSMALGTKGADGDCVLDVDTSSAGLSRFCTIDPEAGTRRTLAFDSQGPTTPAIGSPGEAPYAWRTEVTGDVGWGKEESRTDIAERASVSLRTSENGPPRYLSVRDDRVVLADTPFKWVLHAARRRAAGISYGDTADLQLALSHGGDMAPRIFQPGALPVDWSVSPPLPDGVTLDAADGTLRCSPRVRLPVPAATYAIKASNAAGESLVTLALPAPD